MTKSRIQTSETAYFNPHLGHHTNIYIYFLQYCICRSMALYKYDKSGHNGSKEGWGIYYNHWRDIGQLFKLAIYFMVC